MLSLVVVPSVRCFADDFAGVFTRRQRRSSVAFVVNAKVITMPGQLSMHGK